ncbi:MAG: hypothetical protein ACHQ52_08970 [Candidatus Eisenbacteria bacterium]
MAEQVRKPVSGTREPFAEIARAAIQRAVSETRAPEAVWHLGVNVAWVRFPEEQRWTFLGIHRHLDWISGDAGVASAACDMDDLHPLPGTPERPVAGFRIRLGDLLAGEDRWWRAGENERTLAERLEWMALQLRVKGQAFFSHHPELAG